MLDIPNIEEQSLAVNFDELSIGFAADAPAPPRPGAWHDRTQVRSTLNAALVPSSVTGVRLLSGRVAWLAQMRSS